MLLPVQIQSILYYFLMGWVYALSYRCMLYFIKYMKRKFWKSLIEIIYHIVFTLCLFYGSYCINGGISNIYLIGMFFIGIVIYYSLYDDIFLNVFYYIKKLCYPFYKEFKLVKKKILVIIRLPRNIRRIFHNGKNNKKEKASSS